MRIYKTAWTHPLPTGATIQRDRRGPYIVRTRRDRQQVKCYVRGNRYVEQADRYSVEFYDHLQIKRRILAYREKGATDDLGKQIGLLVYHRRQFPGADLPAELLEWSHGLGDDVHGVLADAGLLDHRRHGDQDLGALIEQFGDYLLVKKRRNERYVRETISKLTTIFSSCNWTQYSEINAKDLDAYLIDLRQTANLSTRTLNGHLSHVRQFCDYVVKIDIAKVNPLVGMEDFGSEAADRRRIRRALTATEVEKLLTTTRASCAVRYGMNGIERALLYQFTLATGLRANEVRSLSVENIVLDGDDGPVVRVNAPSSKHRERDLIPLHGSLVEPLRRFIVDRAKTPQAKLFGGSTKALTGKTSDLIEADLHDAGIDYETAEGTADFHSLRHTFISSLKRIGSREAQGLARHKSSRMTDHYSHRALAEQRAALEKVIRFGIGA